MAENAASQLELSNWNPNPVHSVVPTSEIPQEEIQPFPPVLAEANLAPMMRHYLELKQKYSDYLLLYQVGDFYELFFEDAKIASQALGIRLTSRDKNQEDAIPMCGVPIHAIENYVPKLVSQGYRCVLLSQIEEQQNKKRVIRREITRVITPGIRYEGDGLSEKEFNYLVAVILSPHGEGMVVAIDVSTGQLRLEAVEGSEALIETLEALRPAELILPSTFFRQPVSSTTGWLREVRKLLRPLGTQFVMRPFENTTNEVSQTSLQRFLPREPNPQLAHAVSEITRLSPLAISTLQVLLSFVEEVSFGKVPTLAEITFVESSRLVFLDAATRRNLELLETRSDGEKKNSLLTQIDYSKTAMGSRLLRSWILAPSCDRSEIELRHEAVAELVNDPQQRIEMRACFAAVRDLERVVSRITSLRANPIDLQLLCSSIEELPRLKKFLAGTKASLFVGVASGFDTLEDIREKLQAALRQELPLKINDGGIFRDGYHLEVDRLRQLATQGKEWLMRFEARERERTKISSLRVKYNNVFGYFIEVTKSHLQKVPTEYERRQTLVNAERFVTQELKQFENEALSARAKQIDLERELFIELRDWIRNHVGRIHQVAKDLSLLDVLAAFAEVASRKNYVRPEMLEDGPTIISGGRHPVVENLIGEHNFVANDTKLDLANRRFLLLMGPNMGGKSTYLRQIGLIQILAQAGSFVPARAARLGIVDRIFTRIGAADDITRGDSTFMVEMREAASIIKKATVRSLVLIDEIGRGTATQDGLAIATAIAEWLHDHIGCKTVFATHFHELTRLTHEKDGVVCLAVGVIEDIEAREVTFTHRIEERIADRSYGVEVAKLAGLPQALIARAFAVLSEFEQEIPIAIRKTKITSRAESNPKTELALRIYSRITNLQPNSMTPLQALSEIVSLKEFTERGD